MTTWRAASFTGLSIRWFGLGGFAIIAARFAASSRVICQWDSASMTRSALSATASWMNAATATPRKAAAYSIFSQVSCGCRATTPSSTPGQNEGFSGRVLTKRPVATPQRLEEALADSRVVLVHGPRQCGKTTLARDELENAARFAYFTLDDDVQRAAAVADPVGFVADLAELAVLEEVQRVLFISLFVWQQSEMAA